MGADTWKHTAGARQRESKDSDSYLNSTATSGTSQYKESSSSFKPARHLLGTKAEEYHWKTGASNPGKC
jgi:hypothetical protein